MRLKQDECPGEGPGARLRIHNVALSREQRDRNRNQPSGDQQSKSAVIHSTQWPNNYVTTTDSTTPTTDIQEKVIDLFNRGNNNNNFASLRREEGVTLTSTGDGSEFMSVSSPDDSLGDYEDGQQSSSSLDVSPQGDEYRCFSQEDSDSDSFSDGPDHNLNCRKLQLLPRGIINPNYPGFQHLADQLHQDSDEEDDDDEVEDLPESHTPDPCNNNPEIDSVNQLDSVENFQKTFYDKSKFNIPVDLSETATVEKDVNVSEEKEDVVATNDDNDNIVDEAEEVPPAEPCPEGDDFNKNLVDCNNDLATVALATKMADTKLKMADAFLSGAKEELPEKVLVDKCVLQTELYEAKENKYKYEEKEECVEEDEKCLSAVAREKKMNDVLCSSVSNNEEMNSNKMDSNKPDKEEEKEEDEAATEKFSKEQNSQKKECAVDNGGEEVVPRKKEKMEINYSVKFSDPPASVVKEFPPSPNGGVSSSNNHHHHHKPLGKSVSSSPLSGDRRIKDNSGQVFRREYSPSTRSRDYLVNRRSVPAAREKKQISPEFMGGFDVYNIETAMPKIDLDAIESHLRAAREEERRRRNDREEIRRRLAMGSDADEYYGGERPSRKPSLQSRLQSVYLPPTGMNLQICFMNETVSDNESPNSDTETTNSSIPTKPESDKASPRSLPIPIKSPQLLPTPHQPTSLTLPLRKEEPLTAQEQEMDFFARQARLQAEARLALAQAKEMAHMQMEVERQRQKKSPITEMVRSSLEKVGIPFPADRRRVSRQILTEMNVAQLQVIVNDLHTQIEVLNEDLVKLLMERDDLHMEQDSMLVDIEDLTRYLGAKEQTIKEQSDVQLQNNNLLLPNKVKINRIKSLVKK